MLGQSQASHPTPPGMHQPQLHPAGRRQSRLWYLQQEDELISAEAADGRMGFTISP